MSEIKENFFSTPMLITGCAPDDFCDSVHKSYPDISIATSTALYQHPELIQSVLEGKIIFERSCEKISKTGFVKVREKKNTGIVNISEGCLDACAFCSTHLVKGRHFSYSEESILREISLLIEDGCKEILLTGQDTSCYGFDCGTNLARLVQKIIIQISGNYKIRLGMGNPRHLHSYIDELLETYQDEHLYQFIHLPVQSGSNRILKAMHRQHTVNDYRNLVDAFLTQFPRITLSTDIIVGFPGETQEDFELSRTLIKETRPSLCNITRFVPRPGTVAYKLKNDTSSEERYARSAKIAAEFQTGALENNRQWIGWEGSILIEKEGQRAGTTIGRNPAYRPVALVGKYESGTTQYVKIVNAETFALIATPL
jgi:MiaB/RimO family radical SAM methylthiotransferase